MSRLGGLETRSADVAARKSIHRRRRRASPFWILLLIGVAAAVGFFAWAVLGRDTPVSVLAASLLAIGLVLALVTLRAAVSTYRAGSSGAAGAALLFALVGGMAAILAGLALAAAYALVNLVG